MRDKVGKILQIAGILGLIGGIAYEVLTQAPIGYIIITISAWLFAMGTKLSKYNRGSKLSCRGWKPKPGWRWSKEPTLTGRRRFLANKAEGEE